MKNTMRELTVVWHAAFCLQSKNIIKYLIWLLVLVSAIAPVFVWYTTRNLAKSIGSISAPFSLLFVCLWLTFIAGAVRQNSAANAKLVPHFYTRLIQIAACFGLVGIAINAFFFSFINGDFGWCFVCMLFYAIGISLGQARQHGWPISLMVVAHMLAKDKIPEDVKAMLFGEQTFFVWLVLGLLLGALFIKLTFPRGGDRSWKVRQRMQKQVAQTKDPFGVSKDTGELVLRPYYRALHIACEKRKHDLIIFVLGPNSHWGVLLTPLLMIVTFVLILKGYMLAFPESTMSNFLQGFGWGMASSIIIAMQLSAQNTAMQFSNTRTEQSLYKLTAFAPPAKSLNRKLAQGIVRSKLQGFLLTMAMALGCSALLDVSYDKMVIAFSVCCLTLPYVCLHLRDYSREAMMDIGYARIWQLLGIFVMAPLVIFLAMLNIPSSAWITVAITSIVISTLLIAYRWRNMIAAPVAFPAGRIAT